MRNSINTFRLIIASLVFGALSACGGGGGGGSGGSTSAFNTAEFQANYGLASINALTAFDNSATGSGVIVGVVDTGIDTTHPDLVSNINANSNFVVPTTSSVNDNLGHGTAVSGVIAGVRNSVGTHGVAFNSSILAVKVSDTGAVADADAGVAIDYAVAQNAKVLNLSFGTGQDVSPFLALQNNVTTLAAIQRAVNAGVVVVASSGNGGADQVGDSESGIPAAGANCSAVVVCALGFDAKGLMIAVGAVDSNNNMAVFSNLAGSTASAYMVAPGVDIVTTANGGGTTTVNGTSFSAPHVTGAVALLLQRFPSLTGAQAVSILLSSATDLGATGTDTTFGVGLLNLQAAFAAQGVASIPTSASVSGNSVPLTNSTLILGSAFGNALSGQSFLAEAIILDAYQRAYHVDLRDRIVSGTASLNALSFLTQDDSQVIAAPMPGGLSLNFDVTQADQGRLSDVEMGFAHHVEEKMASHDKIGALRFAADIGRQTRAHMALRSSPLSQFGEGVTTAVASDLFFNNGWTAAPQLSMLGRGTSVSLTNDLTSRWGQGTRLTIGFHHSTGASQSETGRGHLGQARVGHAFDSGLRLGIGAGYVAEEGALFRSTTSGAFGQTANNQSQYYSLSATAPLDGGLTVFAGYTGATARPAFSGDSLLSNWSPVRANAFSAGLVRKSTFSDGDQLGLSIGQPLRVRRSFVDLTLPVARDLEGNVVLQSKRVALEPSGRQMDIQLAYRSRLGGATQFRWFATLSLQPGHDREAEPGAAVGVKWGMYF